MPSFAGDPRHERLVAVLVPLLRRSCPPGGGGFGGSYELRLGVDEAEELGGVALIRSAMRKAGRSLGWARLQTFGGSFPQVVVAGVVDRREIPAQFAGGRASSAVRRRGKDGRHDEDRSGLRVVRERLSRHR